MSIDVNQTSAVLTCYNCQEKGHMARCALKILFHFFNQTLRDCTGQKKGRDNSGLTCYNCQGSGHMARYNANPLNLKTDSFPVQRVHSTPRAPRSSSWWRRRPVGLRWPGCKCWCRRGKRKGKGWPRDSGNCISST